MSKQFDKKIQDLKSYLDTNCSSINQSSIKINSQSLNQNSQGKKTQDQNQLAKDPIQDLNQEIQRELKRRGDTAVHQAVLANDSTLLKELLKRGMPVFNPSDADGGTPLHRAAESCAIDCAKILLEKNADIDAPNLMGKTPLHVSAERSDFEFAKFLLKNRARRLCRPGCIKCRLFLKQLERHEKNQRDLEQHKKETQLEEQKEGRAPEIDLLEEIQRCRDEAGGGPFFNKRENQKFKEQQEKIRFEEELLLQQNYGQIKGHIKSSIEGYQGQQQSIRDIIDIPKITNLLSDALQELDRIKPQNRPADKINNLIKSSQSQQISEQTLYFPSYKDNSINNQSILSQENDRIRSNSFKFNQLDELDCQLNQLSLNDEEKLKAQPPLYLNNIQNNVPNQDPLAYHGSWKKRQKRLEELEEEKKKNGSQDSISYNSDGELQTSFN